MGAVFYFDLASPLAYLAAERVTQVLASDDNDDPSTPPLVIDWQPIRARELAGAETFEAYRCATEEGIFRAEVERRARELGLQPLRWPEPFPFDSELALRVATYARGIARVTAFAQAAFRQAFAGGHDLGRPDVTLIAAAACEMHPQAVLRGAQLRGVREQLADATARAAARGVSDVPAVALDDGPVFVGERAPEQAAEHLRAAWATGAAWAAP